MAKMPEKGSKTAAPVAPGVKAAAPAGKMEESQVQSALEHVPEWSELGDTIQRTYQFKNFMESMAFVQQVAGLAEADQHHPDILIRYNKVTLTLSTHDSGGITRKDFDAARKYDGKYETPAVKK